ncbi:RmlC-like cupin [Aspergillus terreus]|uniref:RmlC-like cupin n=1 Tax=Aspergillus terreus TaxID=33178 RepID=A0A5M3YPN1_ASPTE|nr:hypothetical protein ATETN484_0002065600 [Aspergillus terreus]GFF15512.1 RmlC-like cupin [Aspergillus terreus]
MSVPRVSVPPNKVTPYLIPAYAGEKLNLPGSKSTIRVLASAEETEGTISVFHMDGVLGDPVGFHHHNEAHDIFMCTKGYMKVWAGDQARLLGPGDFCSVPKGIVHRPQLVGPWNETIGLVTPGKWIDFFRFVSEPYDGVLADQFDDRSTLAAMMPKFQTIQDDYDVIFHPEHQACEVGEWSEKDTVLPDGVEPYYLRANTGPRYVLGGVLSRPFITTRQSGGKFAITSIESSSIYGPTVLAHPFTFDKVHQIYTVLDGSVEVTVNGDRHTVRVGESVLIPRGTTISVQFTEKYCRFWAFASGDGLETLISTAGTEFGGMVVPDKTEPVDFDVVKEKVRGMDLRW